ncbi:DUF6112 family protein [Jiangella muralis]|uniref:DUF6112 family protein n=1 Tax=Jiangella muralis TaxID=702383 RepID=UPI00069F95FD|nr:DUF6112 family protein [Jiangella muralis]
MPHIRSTRSRGAQVFPDLSAVNHASDLAAAVGALLTVVLVVAVLMLIVCAAAWAMASAHGNYHAAVRARTGVWVSVGAAGLAGAGMAWINFLMDVGSAL